MTKKFYSVVYWYTTDLNKKVFRVKNGSARRRANSAQEAAEARIKEQLTAKDSADPYTILHVEDVSDLCETGEKHESLSKLRKLEQSFLHTRQKKLGMWVPSENLASEWFFDVEQQSVDNVVKVGKKLINEYRHGVQALFDFPLFNYQEKIVDWAINQFKLKNDILINAIMRAGKCFISYEIARRLNVKNLLIVTAKVGVNDSWAALLPNGEESHVYYHNWKYNNYNDLKKKNISIDSQVNVFFVSLQYINTHFDSPSLLLQEIFSTNWDLVVFDEQHYATVTDNTQKFFDRLNFTKKIELSGTPYKTVLSGRYDTDSIYNFDYVDEQLIRKSSIGIEAEKFKYRADINYAMVNIPEKVKSYLGEDGFTFLKLFATENGNFINHVAVGEFIQFVISTYKNPPKKYKNYAGKLCEHTLWILPNDVSAINALEKFLLKHPFFSKRTIINASGKGVKDIQTVKNLIQNNKIVSGAGTITLTCGRFLEGTSVPEWWSVHQMNNDKSASDYFQGSFRCKTPYEVGRKESVVVFDYAPERFISVVYQYCEQVSIVYNKPVEQIINQWLSVSEVYDYVGNEWNILSGEDIASTFLSNIENHMDRIGNAINVNGIDDNIISLLIDKKKDTKSQSLISQINSNDILEGKNKVKLNNKKNNRAKEKDDITETLLRIKFALRQIFKLLDVAWAEGLSIKTIDDIINYKDVYVVYEITGLVPNDWKNLTQALNITAINRAIGQYNDYQ